MQTLVRTPEHGLKGMGWKRDRPDHRDRIFNLERRVEKPEALDLIFSLRGQMPPIWDQLELGACVPHGTGAVFEHRAVAEGEAAKTPSRLFIYYNGRVIEHTVDEDSGLEVRDGIKAIAEHGAPSESLWPYDIAKFTDKPPSTAYSSGTKHEALEYLRIEPGGPGSPLRTPLSKGQPIVFGFTVPEMFESPKWNPATDVLPLPRRGEGVLGGHCTVMVGWDFSLKRFPVPAFEIRNSWGKEWGDEGHFWMDARWLYEPSRNLSADFWIIERVA